MTDRTPITEKDISKNNFDKDKEYVLKDNCLRNLHYYEKNINSLEINLLVEGNMFLSNLPCLKFISKNIIIERNIYIDNCPLLKTIPFEVTFDKKIHFDKEQFYITILSKEQFLSTKQYFITDYTNKGGYSVQNKSH